MIVCVCCRVNDAKVRDVVLQHDAKTLEELQKHIEIGTCCGSCHDCACMIIDETIAGECDGSTKGS